MKKITAVLTLIVAMSTGIIASAYAPDQVYNFADSIDNIATWAMTPTVDTSFTGEKLMKLAPQSTEAVGKEYVFTFSGNDVNNNPLSIQNTYLVVDYYWQSSQTAASGVTTHTQINTYADGLGNSVGTTGNSLFGRENGIVLNKWAPMVINLNKASNTTSIRATYPKGAYKTIRIYPAYSSSKKTVGANDVLYFKQAKFYKSMPHNLVYDTNVEFKNGKVTATAQLYQLKGATKGATAILALYDSESDRMIDCKVAPYHTISLTENAFNDISLSMDYDTTKDQYAKLMFFQDFASLMPICESVKADYIAPMVYGNDNELEYPDWFSPVGE